MENNPYNNYFNPSSSNLLPPPSNSNNNNAYSNNYNNYNNPNPPPSSYLNTNSGYNNPSQDVNPYASYSMNYPPPSNSMNYPPSYNNNFSSQNHQPEINSNPPQLSPRNINTYAVPQSYPPQLSPRNNNPPQLSPRNINTYAVPQSYPPQLSPRNTNPYILPPPENPTLVGYSNANHNYDNNNPNNYGQQIAHNLPVIDPTGFNPPHEEGEVRDQHLQWLCGEIDKLQVDPQSSTRLSPGWLLHEAPASLISSTIYKSEKFSMFFDNLSSYLDSRNASVVSFCEQKLSKTTLMKNLLLFNEIMSTYWSRDFLQISILVTL